MYAGSISTADTMVVPSPKDERLSALEGLMETERALVEAHAQVKEAEEVLKRAIDRVDQYERDAVDYRDQLGSMLGFGGVNAKAAR